jgi:hypothetical protein
MPSSDLPCHVPSPSRLKNGNTVNAGAPITCFGTKRVRVETYVWRQHKGDYDGSWGVHHVG